MKIITETQIEIPDPPDKFRVEGGKRATVGVETMALEELDAIGAEWLDKLKKRAAILRKAGLRRRVLNRITRESRRRNR